MSNHGFISHKREIILLFSLAFLDVLMGVIQLWDIILFGRMLFAFEILAAFLLLLIVAVILPMLLSIRGRISKAVKIL